MPTAAQKEKRVARRFSLQLPVSVKDKAQGPIPAETRDVSSRGICFLIDSSMAVGSELEFTLTLPPEVTLTDSMQVHCTGRIVRVEKGDQAGRTAVAAVIDQYDFLPER